MLKIPSSFVSLPSSVQNMKHMHTRITSFNSFLITTQARFMLWIVKKEEEELIKHEIEFVMSITKDFSSGVRRRSTKMEMSEATHVRDC